MFVSETSIFNPPTIRIRVTNMQGGDLILDVKTECTVDDLKILAVSHFGDPAVVDSSKVSLYHKLLHVGFGRYLNEENTITQEGLRDSDEILLVKKRIPPPPLFDAANAKKTAESIPTSDEIKKATEGMAAVNLEREPQEAMSNIDFQAELRRILISLIDAAQKILCLNPEASKIFKEAEKYLEEQKDDTPKVDKAALQQLLDMGFQRTRAIKALMLNKMIPANSIQWLFDHESDPDIDEALPNQPTDAPAATTSGESGAIGGAPEDDKDSNDSQQELSRLSGAKKVANMLESFRAFRRREFRANPRALKNLTDMGFAEKDVLDALRISGNKEEEACEWLLNDNKTIQDKDLEEGLDTEGPIYKAIMANPIVQLGLSNPRSLLAFLHMLENPSNTQQWLNDPDTGPMLVQISRIYHAEKHAP